jgi:hypothetical protein
VRITGLCEAQTETCKGVLLMLQMDDLAEDSELSQWQYSRPKTEAHPMPTRERRE